MKLSYILTETDGTVSTTDPDKAEKLAKKGVNVKLTDELAEQDHNHQELLALGKEIEKSLIKSLESIGDEVVTSSIEIEEDEIFVDILFADDEENMYQFFTDEDKVYLHVNDQDIELVDFGITPGGKIILNNELLTDRLTKYFKQEISEKVQSKVLEKKGKDLDGDGDIDSDDYLAARNNAIKKAMKKEDKEEDYELKQDPDTKEFYRRPKLSDKDRVTLMKIKKLLDKEKAKKASNEISDYQDESGLIVIGRTPLDNNSIGEVIEDLGLYAEWNSREGYWLFPEEEETYDQLEMLLTQEFNRRGIRASFEGVFENVSHDNGGDLDIGHQDDEPDMIKQEVYEIAEYASKLYVLLNKLDKLSVEVDFPHWWQSKVTKARLYIGKATHYLAYELKQDAIDASLTEAKATCCGRCGRKHVKGTPCRKPYISKNSPRHCQNK